MVSIAAQFRASRARSGQVIGPSRRVRARQLAKPTRKRARRVDNRSIRQRLGTAVQARVPSGALFIAKAIETSARNTGFPAVVRAGGETVGIFKTLFKVARSVLGAPSVSVSTAPAAFVGTPAASGGLVSGRMGFPSGTGGTLGKKKRRRRRRRITSRELEELILLKQVVGPRSPLLTIAGIRMLGRGG